MGDAAGVREARVLMPVLSQMQAWQQPFDVTWDRMASLKHSGSSPLRETIVVQQGAECASTPNSMGSP